MMSFISRIFKPAEKPQPLPAGLYHWQTPPQAKDQYRLHLRLEPDHTGLLIINASTVLHLNATAAAHAYYIVQGNSAEEAAAAISDRFWVNQEQARQDQDELRAQIETLATNPEVDPVLFMEVDRQSPYAQKPSAPYRLDLALTYRIDESGHLDPLARERVDRELNTDEWSQILEKAWMLGIPHVIFTGGEPTLRPDLVELIQKAESLGQVSGVLTNGIRLAESGFMQNLEQAGLDHLLITLDETNPQALEGLRTAIDSDVFTVVHLTLSGAGVESLQATLVMLQEIGVTHLSLSSKEKDAPAQKSLAEALDLAAGKGFTIVWDIPVPFSQSNPIAAELEDAPDGAGIAWLYVEPDGDVLPAQGVNQILGNILTQPFKEIWRQ